MCMFCFTASLADHLRVCYVCVCREVCGGGGGVFTFTLSDKRMATCMHYISIFYIFYYLYNNLTSCLYNYCCYCDFEH